MQATGFTDAAPVVREQTLKSVLVIVTKLSDRTINGELLRQLARTANDEQAGIRTNTTICLGKLAKNMGSGSRSKVLIAAFSRSLRDPFVHARNAALMALGATAEYFTKDDCANRILPVICPLLIDPEKLARDSANRTLDVYLQKIKKAATDMPDSILPPPQAADAPVPRMSAPQASESTGWAGWAVSSFTNKLSAAAGDMKTANGSGTASPAPHASPSSTANLVAAAKKPISSSTPNLHRQVLSSPPQSSRAASPNPSALAEEFWPDDAEQDGADAWGEMGEMGDDDAFINPPIQASQRMAKGSAVTSPAPFQNDDEPDFAAWLTSQAQKKSGTGSKPLPKGLSKTTITNKRPTIKPVTKSLPAKKLDMKPKETNDDDGDGWGDGW